LQLFIKTKLFNRSRTTWLLWRRR